MLVSPRVSIAAAATCYTPNATQLSQHCRHQLGDRILGRLAFEHHVIRTRLDLERRGAASPRYSRVSAA